MAKTVNYKSYKNKFEKIVRDKVPVTGCKFDTYVSETIENAADFKQCYSPNSRVRKQLPKYWFISKEGFLINVKGKEPAWVSPNLSASRPEFKPSTKDFPKKKSITAYDLVALTWGSFISPDASYLLETYGAAVIGRNKKDRKGLHTNKVQGHHWNREYIHEKDIDSYILNNEPGNIQLVTNKEHDILHKLSKDNQDIDIFYSPDFRNVHSEAPVVYIFGEKPQIKLLTDIEIKEVINWKVDFLEKDSYKVGGFTFIGTDKREFFESYSKILKVIVQHLPKSKYIQELNFLGETVYFKYDE